MSAFCDVETENALSGLEDQRGRCIARVDRGVTIVPLR
jgi:hypothetical protein